jgi:nitroreductase
MDVTDAIRKRRSIRRYRPDQIPDEVLNGLLETLRLAPSGCNTQPWKFVVVKDAETRKQLARACRWHPGRPDGQWFVAEAPVVVVACGLELESAAGVYRDGELFATDASTARAEVNSSPGKYWTTLLFDLAIALDHFSLAAAEQGLGTCWIAGLLEGEVKTILSIPDDVIAPLVMPVGYPVEWPAPKPRKPLSDIVCYDSFR